MQELKCKKVYNICRGMVYIEVLEPEPQEAQVIIADFEDGKVWVQMQPGKVPISELEDLRGRD